jgi:hypothetical protein
MLNGYCFGVDVNEFSMKLYAFHRVDIVTDSGRIHE